MGLCTIPVPWMRKTGMDGCGLEMMHTLIVPDNYRQGGRFIPPDVAIYGQGHTIEIEIHRSGEQLLEDGWKDLPDPYKVPAEELLQAGDTILFDYSPKISTNDQPVPWTFEFECD